MILYFEICKLIATKRNRLFRNTSLPSIYSNSYRGFLFEILVCEKQFLLIEIAQFLCFLSLIRSVSMQPEFAYTEFA